MNRGEIYWINFEPSIGSEITKIRPAIIVSNSFSNLSLQRVQVIPVTSNTSKVYPCEALVFVKDKVGKAMADQITTIDKSRVKGFIGLLSEQDINKINKIIRLQLDV